MESENIRRFLFFPLTISFFLVLTQLFRLLLSWLCFQYQMADIQRLDTYMHDTYIINFPFSLMQVLAPLLTGALIGLIVGSAFAALDYRVNLQKYLDGRDGIQSLPRNLFISGAILWLTLPGHAIAMNFVLLWPIHRRYHAYPPEMQFFERLAVLPTFFIALALLWAMVKTLQRYKPRKFSALYE